MDPSPACRTYHTGLQVCELRPRPGTRPQIRRSGTRWVPQREGGEGGRGHLRQLQSPPRGECPDKEVGRGGDGTAGHRAVRGRHTDLSKEGRLRDSGLPRLHSPELPQIRARPQGHAVPRLRGDVGAYREPAGGLQRHAVQAKSCACGEDVFARAAGLGAPSRGLFKRRAERAGKGRWTTPRRGGSPSLKLSWLWMNASNL